MVLDAEKIKAEGVKLLDGFSEKLSRVPDSSETHYVVELKNVFRPDGTPECGEDFQDKIKKNAPRFEDGYVVAEKAE
ncbi:MAG TPA: Asp-tRNA(Asn) amidotransferase subunit GatC [Candidatus Altiarchaeales archaeon]|nr:Asp-tRNA(Asn) amidotransferase subunit GatC [Candidatus Altiarchaeales archaeon]